MVTSSSMPHASTRRASVSRYPAPRSSASREFLSFMLDGQEYGLDCARVHELKLLGSLERFATDGEIIGGVALSHGVIMPIVDMRAGRAQAAATGQGRSAPDTDVIILRLSSGLVGMVVESVTGIVHVRPEAVQPLPGAPGAGYLIGMARIDGRKVLLIDIDRLMSLSPRRPLRAA
jgi:purine-binding chemotaxis protein CheW